VGPGGRGRVRDPLRNADHVDAQGTDLGIG
jgi:hypothetical protein